MSRFELALSFIFNHILQQGCERVIGSFWRWAGFPCLFLSTLRVAIHIITLFCVQFRSLSASQGRLYLFNSVSSLLIGSLHIARDHKERSRSNFGDTSSGCEGTYHKILFLKIAVRIRESKGGVVNRIMLSKMQLYVGRPFEPMEAQTVCPKKAWYYQECKGHNRVEGDS